MRRCALLAVAALLVAGCEGSSDDSAGGDDLSAGLKGQPIKLAMIYDGTGPASIPELPEGARAAVRAVNEEGGIDGAPLELIVCDTRSNPNRAAECGRQAVDEGVIALAGSATQFAQRYAHLMEENRIPNIGTLPSGPADFISNSVFPIVSGPTLDIVALARFLADEGAKRIATARPDLPAAAVTSNLVNASLAPLDLEIVADVGVPTSAPDVSSYVNQITSADADAVVVILIQQSAVQFIQKLRQEDPDIKIGLQSTSTGPVAEALGDSAEGILLPTSLLPPTVSNPATEKYKREMEALGYDDLSGYRENSWLTVHVIADLIRKHDAKTSDALWTAISKTSGLRTGLTPPLQWVKGGAAGAVRTFNACSMAVKWDADGQPQPVTGDFYDPYADKPCPPP
jgi:branched-chain amino acid transport system substrate-binding protein